MTDHKYKGTDQHNPRAGQGRLRRANSHDAGRVGGWERHAEDEDYQEKVGATQRTSHGGEHLLALFNRLARGIGDADGTPGEICGFAGKQVLVRDDTGAEQLCEVRQVLKKMIAGVKNPLCVGDRVRVVCGAHGEAVLTAVEPRRNQLARGDSHNRALMAVFAANVDCLLIAVAATAPEPKPALIDRYLVLAAANAIPAALAITKTDLAEPTELLTLYRSLGSPVFATAVTADVRHGLDDLRAHLRGKACVIAGQSGVGKSTLANTLFTGLDARVGVVAEAGHGRHTTTSSRSYVLPHGGRLIDTPGIKECAIIGLTPVDVALLYSEFAPLQSQCHFTDCTHRHEPDCAVRAAVKRGDIAISRYISFCNIVDEDLAL